MVFFMYLEGCFKPRPTVGLIDTEFSYLDFGVKLC